jgi:AcrR family transcriptional regulator
MSTSEALLSRPLGIAATTPTRRAAARPRRSQTERSEETQLRLVEAAVKILRKKGYAGLRSAEVSRVAKVSRGGQLHHFPSKDDLVAATAEHMLKLSLDRGRVHAREAMESDDVLEAIIRDSMDFFFGEDFKVILDLVMTGGKNRKIRDQVYGHAKESRQPVEAAWIEVLVARGLPRVDAEKVLWITVSIVRGLAIRAFWQDDEALFRSVLDGWKDIVVKQFGKKLKPQGETS